MDRDLLDEAQQGSGEAFGMLVAGSVDRCYAIAYRILRDAERAHDSVQEALVGAWIDLPSLRDPARFEAWLTRLVVNACYTEARRERRWQTKLRLLPVENPVSPDTTGAVADRDELERAFGRLTVEQRTVVVLHYFGGQSSEEIASMLRIPAGTVRSRLHHAMRQLRAAVESDGRAVPKKGDRSA